MTLDEIRVYHYHKLLISQESEIILPSGDGEFSELWPYDIPHWPLVRHQDTTWIPPNGGGPWGWWDGQFVYCYWWPEGEHTDLYFFTNPLFAAQHIYKLIFHCLIGRNQYPYGKCRLVLSTHHQLYYTNYIYPEQPSQWFEPESRKNPYTHEDWTREEVQSLQAGIAMDTQSMYGRLMCDQIFIELRYV